MVIAGYFRLGARVALSLLVVTAASLVSAEWNERVLYSFQGGTDGQTPAGGVVFDKTGNLYGATVAGGASNCSPIANCGAVYQLKGPAQKGGAWTETVLYVFKGKASNDGDAPSGSLLIDSQGNLYGATAYGGSGSCTLAGIKGGCGTVFRLSPPTQKAGTWKETILYSFKGGTDGYVPSGDLTFDTSGNLYGVTLFGGGKGTGLCDPFYQYCGTVFRLSPPTQKGGKWTETVLHSFAAGNDGYYPNGGLVFDSKGNLYGTTPMGGNQLCNFGNYKVGCGIVFRLAASTKMCGPWTEEILHRFTDMSDGAGPDSLAFDSSEVLYGAAGGGGPYERGLVFRLSPEKSGEWAETALYDFTGRNDGEGPGGIVFEGSQHLYGTASGGKGFLGVVFRLDRPEEGSSWPLTVLYSFGEQIEGSGPQSRLVFDRNGDLYGTTIAGGNGVCTNGCGTVYELSP